MFYTSVLALFFTALAMLGWGLSVEAFLNDSEIIEINEPGPDAPPPENTVQVGVDTTNDPPPNNSDEGGDSGNETLSLDESGATTTITFSEDTQEQEDDTSTQTSVTTEVSVTTETEITTAGGSSSNDSGGTTNTTETTVSDPAYVIASLIGSGALTVSGGGGGGGGSNGALTDSTVRIDAARARASFRVQRITQLSLSGVEAAIRGRGGNVTQRFNENDFALFVSSKLLRDENIDDVELTGHTVAIEYRALGRLFGIFPMRYSMTVSVDFSAADSVSVDVRFPWYNFFLTTGVSSVELERVLIAEVKNSISLHSDDVFGVATQVFAAVTETLQTYLDV